MSRVSEGIGRTGAEDPGNADTPKKAGVEMIATRGKQVTTERKGKKAMRNGLVFAFHHIIQSRIHSASSPFLGLLLLFSPPPFLFSLLFSSAMMLVHKPQNIILSSPAAYTHRRHPSAPVVVQPTRTPGLLSLSKPVKQSPQRQLPSQQRREPKPVPKVSKHASGVVRAQALTPTAEPHKLGHGQSATPSPKARPNQTTVAKEIAQIHRSASNTSLRGKHGRQPSPPIITQTQLHQPPSQAEATSVPPIKSANLFDPFLDSPPPSPSLSRPSGKLARRRQQETPPASPSPSKAIPVPAVQRSKPLNISRSDPVQSNMRPRPVPKRSSTYQDFPICDDLADAKNYILSPPSTPRRPTNGSRTAPLSSANGSSTSGFPFNVPVSDPLTTPVRGQRKHRRVPSEGVFNMSSDEDVSTGPGGVILNSNVQALFALANKRASLPAASLSTPSLPRFPAAVPPRSNNSSPGLDSLTREQLLEQQAQEKAAFYASSMFQNSPSPEDLPDPLLL